MEDTISTHALREEGDFSLPLFGRVSADFYPRPPRGGRRGLTDTTASRPNFYPRPPRGGRRAIILTSPHDCVISTHALREEGDFGFCNGPGGFKRFLPTPSARRATDGETWFMIWSKFLPTPSARRATWGCCLPGYGRNRFLPTPSARRATSRYDRAEGGDGHFYPRPPRGGRLRPRQRRTTTR